MDQVQKKPEQVNPQHIEVIHQEATDSLPEDAAQQVGERREQLAQEQGVSLENAFEQSPDGSEPDNKLMLQAFEWYLPDDGQHWQRLKEAAPALKAMGVGGVWIPPCCKATGTNDVGYGIYDLWDLGEFEQKGSRRTKYGQREELEEAIAALHAQGIQVYADVVLNHKAGADETEQFQVVRLNPDDRNQQLSEPYDIKGWTRFTFPGRAGKYSDFVWGFQHFTAIDYDDMHQESGLFRILGENKGFSPNVDSDKGN